jgi:CheY-like chemotaxis protein
MSRSILIVEDNDLFRGMLSSMLTLRGYNIIVARRGSEALEIAAAQPIDAVLTDVDMPEMDGFEFCARIREQQKQAGQDIPVWIMTGVFRPALAKKASNAGAVLVLRKPFPIEEVCAQIEAEFQKRATEAPFQPPAADAAPSA